jgi:hypothetical protein
MENPDMKSGKPTRKEAQKERASNELKKANFSVSLVCTSSEPTQTATPTIFSHLPGIEAK